MNPTLSFTTIDRSHSQRRGEPVTIGLPLPRSWYWDTQSLTLTSLDGTSIPLQTRTLDTWSDGSARWILLDLAADAPGGEAGTYSLTTSQTTVTTRPPTTCVTVTVTGDGAAVETGVARFVIQPDGELECNPADQPSTRAAVCRLEIADTGSAPLIVGLERIAVEESGLLRAVVLVEASIRTTSTSQRPLRVFIRYHFHAGSAAVRIQITLRNTARSVHAGGFWDLGDPGSVYLKDLSFVVTLSNGPQPWEAFCSAERGQALRRIMLPFELYQDSSGGENWQSSNHVNRGRRLPVGFRGYRMRAGDEEQRGVRATPVVAMRSGSRSIAVAHSRFWERFPKAIEIAGTALTLGLLPRQYGEAHELQGGEQITEEFVVCFGDDPVTDVPLDWVRNPLLARADPEWYCAAEAIQYLAPAEYPDESDYIALVNAAIESQDTFFHKREKIDEYGWRNFGDLYADHEAVRHRAAQPLVSHYNNQYDAIAGFGRQFFRTGDFRWLTLMADLARHVIDIDIYHTDEDKAAYNHGLFWHTAHYTDADRATHRTYTRAASLTGGGPSAEHNYSTGLMLYYFLTGDAQAREVALDLARWVIDMDDGARSLFRWLSRRPTGFASATASFSYHGPGRGAGNSIVTLLNAYRMTLAHEYLRKADELIRRCSHPADDIAALNLLDAERRWSYTVFLRALGDYLDVKEERGDNDAMYAYSRATLLHYARWMAEHEYPFLDTPEILEFPTETWAAQDMRKTDIFCYAAKHTEGQERARFLERAEFFFQYSVRTLSDMPTRTLTRPVVLMLSSGHMRGYMRRTQERRAPAVAADVTFGSPAQFVPQLTVAVRWLVTIAILTIVVGVTALMSLL